MIEFFPIKILLSIETFGAIQQSEPIIHFKLNKNLQGRHIKRAISDFERVTKLSENHAFAWNCLALGYEKMQLQEKVKFAKNKTKEIVNNSNYWKNKFEQLEFKPIY